MPIAAAGKQTRVIVIPRPLEGFFYERLTSLYADRADVQIVVDRRVSERRAERWTPGPGPLTDRRRGDRRSADVAWSLRDMPFAVS
jgi:hypothetical protein